MKENESPAVAEFKSFKQALSLMEYGDFYFKSVLSHIEKIPFERKISLNQYYDCINQKTDRLKFYTAILYIESSDGLQGKKIVFIERDFEKCVFCIEKKIVFKILT